MTVDVADPSSVAAADDCKAKHGFLEGEEDGEILEDVASDSKTDSEVSSTCLNDPEGTSDDEPPEEILNSIAKEKAEEIMPRHSDIIDPKLCAVCQKTPYKYRCPKCDMRTCSLPCSKEHKEVKQCDGVRPPYQPVSKLSQFDSSKSIQDQQFLHAVKNNISKPQVNSPVSPDQHGSLEKSMSSEMSIEKIREGNCFTSNGVDNMDESTEGLRYKANSAQERYLVQNALRRRIWLSFTDNKGGEDSSRHEQFSDTIFWCVDLIFTKQLEDGTASEYNYRVQNIPETIRVETVLRQFLKPRQHGCIVSKSDLDLEKMAPFIEGGIENLNGFMLVPNMEPERYYGINFGKDFLHNMRNRVIVNHPRIIITLNTEFISSHHLISELEAEEIREKQRLSRAMYRAAEASNSGSSDRCAPRRGRGDFRGGQRCSRGAFRGGFRDGGDGHRDHGGIHRGGSRGFKDRYNRKREYNFNDRRTHENKRGRSDSDSRRQPSHNYRSLDDEFDPFEPFEGPVRLPQSYLGSGKSDNENAHSEKSFSKSDSTEQTNSAIKTWEQCIAQKEKSTGSPVPE